MGMRWKKCEHCGAPIAWMRTAKGKWMPVENITKRITPGTLRNSRQRPYTVIDGRGHVHRGGEITHPDDTDYVVVGWVVHWGRCIIDAKRAKEKREQRTVKRMLTSAAINDNADGIRQLIQQGHDIHAEEDEALYAAVFAGKVRATQALLLAGADPTARDYGFVLVAADKRQDEIGMLLGKYMSKAQKTKAAELLIRKTGSTALGKAYGLIPKLEVEQQSLGLLESYRTGG